MIPGKIPIRTRPTSVNFHTPLELLCCSLASCVGRNIHMVCSWTNTNVKLIQSIKVGMDNGEIIILIQYSPTIEDETVKDIIHRIKTCEIAKLIKSEIKIKTFHNTIPDSELIRHTRSGCCGG